MDHHEFGMDPQEMTLWTALCWRLTERQRAEDFYEQLSNGMELFPRRSFSDCLDRLVTRGLVAKGSGTTMLEVPNFVGEVFKEIDPEKYPNLRLVDSDYTYSNEYEAGKVISQDPVARTQVAEGSTVKLVISNGPQTGQMGDLVNRTEEKAREYLDGLKDLHLSVTLEEEFSSDIAAGRVTRTDPEADEILTVGQTVTLWISKGPQTATLDDLAGQPQTNAELSLIHI